MMSAPTSHSHQTDRQTWVLLSFRSSATEMKRAITSCCRERDWRVLDLRFHDGQVPDAKPPPDGAFVAAFAAFMDVPGTLAVWRSDTGELVRTIEIPVNAITALALAADGSCLAAGDVTGQIKFWPLP